MPPVPTPTKIQRFVFSSFGEKEKGDTLVVIDESAVQEVQELIPDPPAPPMIHEEELEAARMAARQEGYERGYREGMEASRASLAQEMLQQEAKTQEILSLIANRIVIAAELQSAYRQEQDKVTAALVMEAAKKVAAEALQDYPYALVESLLAQCSALIAGEPRIAVRVAPVLYPGVQQKKEDLLLLLKDFSGSLELHQDEAVAEYDCIVEWKNGYAERNTASLWQEIEHIIAHTPLKGT